MSSPTTLGEMGESEMGLTPAQPESDPTTPRHQKNDSSAIDAFKSLLSKEIGDEKVSIRKEQLND